MIVSTNETRYGATPVLSRAGGVLVPLPRSLNETAQVIRAPSRKGPPHRVIQRRLQSSQQS